MLTAKSPPGSVEFPGLYLSEGMLEHLRSRGVPILLGHRVTQAVQNGAGAVMGVEAEHEGRAVFVRARRGVVFASGGFAHDRDKLRSHLRGPIFGSCSVTASDGAFVDIGGKAGAELGNLSNGFYYQASLEDAAANDGFVLRPDAHVFFPYGDGTILVNKYGQRVVEREVAVPRADPEPLPLALHRVSAPGAVHDLGSVHGERAHPLAVARHRPLPGADVRSRDPGGRRSRSWRSASARGWTRCAAGAS